MGLYVIYCTSSTTWKSNIMFCVKAYIGFSPTEPRRARFCAWSGSVGEVDWEILPKITLWASNSLWIRRWRLHVAPQNQHCPHLHVQSPRSRPSSIDICSWILWSITEHANVTNRIPIKERILPKSYTYNLFPFIRLLSCSREELWAKLCDALSIWHFLFDDNSSVRWRIGPLLGGD
jgi:hypothetical protein